MMLVAPEQGAPEISVVMVTHGAWELTETAIAALVSNTAVPFELIIVDNRSDDDMRARLAEMSDVRVVFNDENRGFGHAANQGAEQARARFLLLLNSDAFVHRGWLEPLLDAMRDDTVGAAVPRLLHRDGTLQDAGPLLAKDGSVLVYGDGDDPERLCYRFRRVVDSGSAACLLMKRDVFKSLDGFDEAYAPAYYEDADLCLRLAQRGLRVLYEPRSSVTHVRYGSSGSERAIALSKRNRRLFADRWGSALIGRPGTFRFATEQAVVTARDAMATPRVLVCAPASEMSAGAAARSLMATWPAARVTWAIAPPESGDWAPDPWLELGIELVDEADTAWLDARLFHYDAVVLGDQPDADTVRALERTQPQARRVALSELDAEGGTLAEPALRTLAAAGIASPRTT